MQRIPSFKDDENEEEDEFNGKGDNKFEIAYEKTVKSSPIGPNKRKRNHPAEILENECGQLNRNHDEQSQSIPFNFNYSISLF